MADVLTKKQRSYNMSMIRSKWTSIERNFHNYLKGYHIRHKMHPKIYGNPDIMLKDCKTLIFIDGCFWHGCPQCYQAPKSNKKYWMLKIEKNRTQDLKVFRSLRKQTWNVLRIWEHDLRNHPAKELNKILKKTGIVK